MLRPCRTSTRPCASVIQRPAWPGGLARAEDVTARRAAIVNMTPLRTRFTDKQLNDHRVHPLPTQFRVPLIHAHLSEAKRSAQSKARLVLRKDAADQLPVTARLAFADQSLHRRAPGTLPARVARH